MVNTIVVTGGTAGVGLATAERFAKEGWKVAIIARDEARVGQARAILEAAGAPQVLGVSADASDAVAIARAAQEIETTLGPISVWVNNAMATVVDQADRITPAEYARVTEATYLSQVYGTLAALRYMKPRNSGSIIQVSSGLAVRPAPLQAAYCGAKAAVTGFTDALRAELIADKSAISLSVIYLPAVNTPQPTWARNHSGLEQILPDPLYNPRLCADAVFLAVKKPQRELWVGRSTAMMVLGQSVAPNFADRQAAKQISSMTGQPIADRQGNLDAPGQGPASIDGPSTTRVIDASTREIYSSRQRDGLLMGTAAALLGLGVVGGLSLKRFLIRGRS